MLKLLFVLKERPCVVTLPAAPATQVVTSSYDILHTSALEVSNRNCFHSLFFWQLCQTRLRPFYTGLRRFLRPLALARLFRASPSCIDYYKNISFSPVCRKQPQVTSIIPSCCFLIKTLNILLT